jgi:adenosylhomocysteine nucleosidase
MVSIRQADRGLVKILMVAADKMEFAGFARPVRAEPHQAGYRTIGTHEFHYVCNGAGKVRAAAAVDSALKHFKADAVLSTGFCGALAPELSIAEIVVATFVTENAKSFPALAPQCDRPHHKGVVLTIDHVAQTAKEKSSLRESGGCVVEMEAAGVAAQANLHSLPFYCVRTVTDLAGEDMANDFNAALREDGHFATMNILKGTLRKPLVRLPELVRLRNRCVRAARILGEFIADCRF